MLVFRHAFGGSLRNKPCVRHKKKPKHILRVGSATIGQREVWGLIFGNFPAKFG